jgi:hypothetical protein
VEPASRIGRLSLVSMATRNALAFEPSERYAARGSEEQSLAWGHDMNADAACKTVIGGSELFDGS